MRNVLNALILIVLWASGLPAFARDDTGWSYEGPYGPDAWADLAVDFATCRNGEQQSPVDLTDAVQTRLRPIELHWRATDWALENTGRTISARPSDGGYALIGGARFDLLELSLRNPSEHSLNGIFYPMEMQFLHRSEAGELAVLAVFVEGGAINDRFDRFMAKAPVEQRRRMMLEGFDATGFVTDLSDLMRYEGSLTTPPCTQNVSWSVLTDPLEVSDAALLAFNALFAKNARPIQPLNRRYILTD